jgi:ATP adenylyltransferase
VANDPIWAPWRMGYILSNKDQPRSEDAALDFLEDADPGCFLCQAAVDPDQRSSHVVLRTEHVVTLLNLFPYNNGHLLIAPKKHIARLDQLTADVQRNLLETITQMVTALEQTVHPEGFNIGLNLGRVAGAGVPGHLHWHIVPRWSGDTNFMPVLSDTHVIPQSLDALWNLLTENLHRRQHTVG